MRVHRFTLISSLSLLVVLAGQAEAQTALLNVSYDPTRELYQAINKAFLPEWKAKSGQDATIQQSHGGSGAQARAVIDGQEADVVTLALAADIDAIARAGLTGPDWATRLPNRSVPYTSTIVFLVRKGNPKHIEDWGDLVKPGVAVITPNPKISGGARWAYLAAYGYALDQYHDPARAKDYLAALFRNVPVMDTGSRGATTTFAQRGIGDVLLGWENEAYLALAQLGADKFEIVVPPHSIRADPPVAEVDKNVAKHGTKPMADAYLQFLYTSQAQEIEAENHYRPIDATVAQKHAGDFRPVKLDTIDRFGGWDKVQADHFDDGALFDQITASLGK